MIPRRRKDDLPPPFQGEMMVCIICGRKEKSDPQVSSNWTTIEIRGMRFYGCPACVPGPFPESPDQVKAAYERFVTAALIEMRAHI